MEEGFAALRFFRDPNLCGRLYWYLAPFPVSAGERVLAPVGVHDRLQCAVVELTAPPSQPPYPPALCKRIAARAGARNAAEGVIDLGGVRYDDRHYTRFGAFLYETAAGAGASLPYPVTRVEAVAPLEALAAAQGCVLITGEGAEALAKRVIGIARGGEEGRAADLIRAKLCR